MDLRDRFPDMEPVTKAPSMSTVNGIGARLCGKRDYDPETETYIATLCFCVLYIPIFAMKAYRVLPDGNAWYFIGRHPLSAFAKTANFAMLVGLLSVGAGIGWSSYTGTAEYKAGQQLTAAKESADAGRVAEAAQTYRQVFAGKTSKRTLAVVEIVKLAGTPLDTAPASEAAEVLSIAVVMELNGDQANQVNVYVRGLELIDLHGETDPAGAMKIANVIEPLVKDTTALDERRFTLLKRLVAASPNDVQLLSQLAGIHERRGEFEKCESLLLPHINQLDDSEGARILGQILAKQNKIEESFQLLNQYATKRLLQLHEAEKAWEQAVNAVSTSVLAQLNNGSGPKSFYEKYERASEQEKGILVDTYIWNQIRDRPELVDKRKAMAKLSAVVPVALDLGIVRLRRAQNMPDPTSRKKELEAAEQTFLAIKGQAGESDTFNLFLAQVKYWLGKHGEGRQLFDQMLAKNNRDFKTLSAIANTLREVGEETDARAMAEEAYQKTGDTNEKFAAARLRVLISKDDEDRILWLQRSNQLEPDVKAMLAESKGRKAARDGDEEAAAAHYRESATIYASMPISSSSLNNGALAYIALYYLTGERADLAKSIAMQEKAIALSPSSAILVFNMSHSLADLAARDLLGTTIDFKLLKLSADLNLSSYLYHDEASRKQFVDRLRNHAGFDKAVSYYERSRVLSSKRPNSYEFLARYRYLINDLPGLKMLLEQARATGIDLQDEITTTLDHYAGKKDAKTTEDMKRAMKLGKERLDRVRAANPNAATLGMAIAKMIESQRAAASMGLTIEPDDVVKLADEWHRIAPSSRSSSALVGALLMRAALDLAAKQPAFAEMNQVASRSMGHSALIATALQRGGPLAAIVAAHPDVKRAIEQILQNNESFPTDADPFDWAVLKHTHPADAEAVASAIRTKEIAQVEREMDLLLSPMSGASVMNAYWGLLAQGQAAQAEQLLKKAASRGIPLP